jgi:hypothetical protein
MRSLAQNVKNPRTEAQMTQRSKFALTLAFLKPITNYVRVGFKPYASKQTAFNAAMSYIVANAISGEYPNHTLVSLSLVSRGVRFPLSKTFPRSRCRQNHHLVDRKRAASAMPLPTDVAMPLVFNPLKVEAVFSTSAAARADGMAEINLPADWAGDNVEGISASFRQTAKPLPTVSISVKKP